MYFQGLSLLSLLAGLTCAHSHDRLTEQQSKQLVNARVQCSQDVHCILAREATEGPFYVKEPLIRSNLTEDRVGIPLSLNITVLDVNTCEPVPDVYVDIWHTDAMGVYSGWAKEHLNTNSPFNKRGEPIEDSIWLRGVQATGKDGVVSFQTLFPGWYHGRCTHIHLRIHNGNVSVDHGVFVGGGKVAHTGQLFFTDELVTNISKSVVPYSSRSDAPKMNKEDGIYVDSHGEEQTVSISKDGEAFIGTVTVGIDPSADQPEHGPPHGGPPPDGPGHHHPPGHDGPPHGDEPDDHEHPMPPHKGPGKHGERPPHDPPPPGKHGEHPPPPPGKHHGPPPPGKHGEHGPPPPGKHGEHPPPPPGKHHGPPPPGKHGERPPPHPGKHGDHPPSPPSKHGERPPPPPPHGPPPPGEHGEHPPPPPSDGQHGEHPPHGPPPPGEHGDHPHPHYDSPHSGHNHHEHHHKHHHAHPIHFPLGLVLTIAILVGIVSAVRKIRARRQTIILPAIEPMTVDEKIALGEAKGQRYA